MKKLLSVCYHIDPQRFFSIDFIKVVKLSEYCVDEQAHKLISFSLILELMCMIRLFLMGKDTLLGQIKYGR